MYASVYLAPVLHASDPDSTLDGFVMQQEDDAIFTDKKQICTAVFALLSHVHTLRTVNMKHKRRFGRYWWGQRAQTVTLNAFPLPSIRCQVK
jgi:hypothetical protein